MHSYKDPNLKREMIMKHYSNPVHKAELNKDLPDVVSHYSTKCVDEIHLNVTIEDNVITDIKFDGQGCAVHIASADLLISKVIGKTVEQVSELLRNYFNMISQTGDYDKEMLGELLIFENVASHLNRLHCAVMIHDALIKYIGNK